MENEVNPVPFLYEPQVSEKILKVESKISQRPKRVILRDETGKPIEKIKNEPLPLVEILTDDISVSFLTPEDKGVINAMQNALTQIKEYMITYNVDMCGAYNLIADAHNLFLNTSRTERAATLAKSMYVEEKRTISSTGEKVPGVWPFTQK